jgi:hypothetical protein
VVTPAGRKRYLSVLVPYVLREKAIIDKYRFWINTNNTDDIKYIEQLVESDREFFEAEYLDDPKPNWKGNRRVRLICQFFKNCTEPDTVYVRLDDDICWMMNGALRALIDYRIDNPEYFMVYPGIFNNGYTAEIHSALGLIKFPSSSFRKWQRESKWGILHHEKLLESIENNDIHQWLFESKVIKDYAQAPINCISWLGEEFAKFGGVVADENCDYLEEVWLTKIKPKQINKHNCMYGGSLMAHFAFNTQREYFETHTNLLESYEVLSLYDGAMEF